MLLYEIFFRSKCQSPDFQLSSEFSQLSRIQGHDSCDLRPTYGISDFFFSDALVYGAKNKITTQFTLIFGADSADTLEALHSREKKNQKPVDYTTTESYTTEPPYIAGCSALYSLGGTWL